MGKIYRSITELVGKTPLLELANYEKKHDLSAKLLVKLEYFNPNQSIKDRTALNMIEEAEKKGFLFVPISVNIGGREYRDGVDLTKDKFYDLLVNGGEFPQTSQPSPQAFLEPVWQRSQQPKGINSVYTYRIRLVRNVFR